MSIYEYMPSIGYAKHQDYPNGFEKKYTSFVSICIVFNFKKRIVQGVLKPNALIHRQSELDELQRAYHVMLGDLEIISKATGCNII